MNAPTIEDLAQAWLEAKAAEDAASADRLAIEKAMLEHIPAKDEGTTSLKVGEIKVSVSFKVNRSVDAEALQAHWEMLPSEAHRLFRWRPEINASALRSTQELAPAAYALAAQFITAKPGKPSFKVGG